MYIIDWLAVKTLEKKLGRKLTPDEVMGNKVVKLSKEEHVKLTRVSMLWLHNKNSCK